MPVRDLRNDFSALQAWLDEGETMRIEKHGTPVAFLSPVDSTLPSQATRRPDVRARLKPMVLSGFSESLLSQKYSNISSSSGSSPYT